jgi:protease-4
VSENDNSVLRESSRETKPRRSKKAIAAFLLALSGLFLWVFGAVPAVIAAVLAKREIRKNPQFRGRVLAEAALTLGVIEIVFMPLLFWAVLVHGPSAQTERIAHFHLGGTLGESPQADVVGAFMGQPDTFHSLFERLKDAKEDAAVKAVILTFNKLTLRLPEVEELRAALLDFESSGKKIYAHCEDQTVTLPLYVILKAASRVSIAPTVSLDLRGLYTEAMYLKDGLAKIGVALDVVHIGDYKAAGEMLARAEPSDAARENMNWVFDGQYQSCLAMLAESQHKTVDEVKAMIDSVLFAPDRALKEGLVDAVEYQEDVVELVKREYGADTRIDNDYHKEPVPEVGMTHPFRSAWNVARYFARLDRPGSGDGVGLIYLNGEIVDGCGDASKARSGDLRAAFKEAMDDDSIKTVVLRVNSPGGFVTASEVIHRATELLQKKKPLVVSMGNVAASGGYYVSCGAGTIFADETTITGSIGVIGSKLVTADLWKKLGVNWFPYQRGANADISSGQHPYTEQQRAMLTGSFEADCKTFKEHIEAGRGTKLTKKLDDIAGGRIYTGKQALDLGLVDKIGGLEAAIAFAAKSVSLEKYKVRVVPEPKDAVNLLAEVVFGKDRKSNTDLETGAHMGLGGLESLGGTSAEMRGVAALLEGLDRPHAAAAVELLGRLQLMNREGMAMIMPQVFVYQ